MMIAIIYFDGRVEKVDIKDLEIFRTVVNYQNVTKAAIELNYVQSNITNRLMKLEKEFGVTLLIRTNRGVFLTSDGERFLQFANKVLSMYKETLDLFESSDSPTGHLRIGATDITTATRLPNLLMQFSECYPNVELSLVNGSSEELLKIMMKYELDGAFITDGIDQPNFHQEKLVDEELVLITHKSHPQIKTLKDLQKQTILVFKKGCTYRKKLESWMQEEGIIARKMEFGTIEGIVGCVKAGLGVALVSKLIANQLNIDENIQIHEIPEKYRTVTTVFIYRKDVPITNALKKFIQMTKKNFI